MINGLMPQLRNELIKQRFVPYQHRVNDLQTVYDEFNDNHSNLTKKVLKRTCKQSNMKNVLTDIHDEITSGDVTKFNALLNGHRNEMQDALNWHKVFQSLYIQASTLQAICIPIENTEGDVDSYVEKQNKIAESNYQV